MLDYVATIANLLVALATGGLAWVTYGVAKTSRDALLLQVQPQLSFEGVSLQPGEYRAVGVDPVSPALRVGVIFSNPGKVPVDYEVSTDMSFELNGVPLFNADKLYSYGARLYPERRHTFFIPTLALKSSPYAGSKGVLDVSVLYWSDSRQKHRMTLKQSIQISSVHPELAWEWHSLEAIKWERV